MALKLDMKHILQTPLVVFLLASTNACSEGSNTATQKKSPLPKVLRAIPVEEEEEVVVLRAIPVTEEEVAPRRAPLVPEPDLQEIAYAMIGKPTDERFPVRGVYERWLSGDRGFFNPATRRRYQIFAEASLTRARNETKTLYYPFGGPDVIYPLTFFPRTTTLILIGTEPVGTLPSLKVAQSSSYQESMSSMMNLYLGSTFYRTKDMRAEANEAAHNATWAKMMASIALLDLKIVSTESGTISENGEWRGDASTPKSERSRQSPKGVRFYCLRNLGDRSEAVSIYYFQQNLGESDYNSLLAITKSKPFLNFISSLKGEYTSFLKAASFLSHDTRGFKTSNDLVFGGNKIVQAPSGLPFSEFVKHKKSWSLTLFGEYREPSETFSNRHQDDLKEAYRAAITRNRNGEYSDFVTYGGDLPFHYDYGTGTDGRGKGSMLFYAIRNRR